MIICRLAAVRSTDMLHLQSRISATVVDAERECVVTHETDGGHCLEVPTAAQGPVISDQALSAATRCADA